MSSQGQHTVRITPAESRALLFFFKGLWCRWKAFVVCVIHIWLPSTNLWLASSKWTTCRSDAGSENQLLNSSHSPFLSLFRGCNKFFGVEEVWGMFLHKFMKTYFCMWKFWNHCLSKWKNHINPLCFLLIWALLICLTHLKRGTTTTSATCFLQIQSSQHCWGIAHHQQLWCKDKILLW